MPIDGVISDSQIYEADGTTIAKHVVLECPEVFYELWLGYTQVNSLNVDDILGDGGKARFDTVTHTLTLDNPTIYGSHEDSKIYVDAFQGYSKKPWESITINGSYHMSESEIHGIWADHGITLNFGGDFTILGAILGHDINVKSGSLTAIQFDELETGHGIFASSLTIENSVDFVDLQGGNQALNLYWGGGFHLADGYEITSPAGGIFKDNVIYHSDGTRIAQNVIIMNPNNPVEFYDLWVGNRHVNSNNKDDILGDGKASYDPDTHTLMLNDPIIPGKSFDSKIFSYSDLNITGSYHMSEAETKNGIVSEGSLTLNGDFTIFSKGLWFTDSYNNTALYTGNPITAVGDITLNGNITAQGEDVAYAAIYTETGNITVLDGKTQAISNIRGIYCGGTLTAYGSTKSITLEGNKGALYAGNLIIYITEGQNLQCFVPRNSIYLKTYKSIYCKEGKKGYLATRVVFRQVLSYNLWLGNTQVTDLNADDILGDGTASFDPETNTLTLDNPTISGQTNDCAIYSEHIDLTIEGSATVSTTASCGIKVLYGRLTCDGNFSFTGGEYALWATNGLRLGQTIDVTSPNNAKVNQIGKEYTVYESDGNTVAKSVTIQNLDKYKIWLGSTQVTSLNLDNILGDGRAKYDPETRTLTLNNPNISGTCSQSKIYATNTDLTIKGNYNMNEAESTFGLYVSGGTLKLGGNLTFRGNSMGIVSDDHIYVRGNINAYGDSWTGIKATKGLTIEHGLMPTRLEMIGGDCAYDGGRISPSVTLVTPGGGSFVNYGEITRIMSGGEEATEVVLEYLYPNHGNGTQESPYLIKTSDDWTLLAEDIEIGLATVDKYFELVGNVTATKMLGTDYFPFKGMFNGNKQFYSLNADIYEQTNGVAPFHVVEDGATIKNLHVKGTVHGVEYTAGIVGFMVGSNTMYLYDGGYPITLVDSCEVSARIMSSGYHNGGIVGHINCNYGRIWNCVFRGSFYNDGTDPYAILQNGTLLGWNNKPTNNLNITNCLDVTDNDDPMIRGNYYIFIKRNNYFTSSLKVTDSDNYYMLGAKRAYRVTGSDVNLTLTGSTGVMWNGAIYAAKEQTINFTVDPSDAPYTSTSGTFTQDADNCSLEMPAENVTILNRDASPYEIITNIGEHGTVTVAESSKVGAVIFMRITPDDYYLLDELTVKDENGNDIDLEIESMYHIFRMPSSDVTVTATFKKKYSLENGVLHLLCGDFSGGASINSWDPFEVHTGDNANVISVVADPGVRFTGFCGGLFQNFSNCTSIDLSNVETSTMTAMTGMFADCSSLTTLNLTGIKTAQVTDMSHLFENCISLRELDLTVLDISKATRMDLMFDQAGISKLTLPAGMAVTLEMGLKDGRYGRVGNEWKYSGWILLGSNGTVVSTAGTITVNDQQRIYAQIPAPPIPMTIVWKHMPDDFVLELPDGVDNTETIELWQGVTVNVKLTDHVLYKDGCWNTLSLPFYASYSTLSSALPGADIYRFDNQYYYDADGGAYDYPEQGTHQTGYDTSTGILRIYYFWSSSMDASKPYIIRWNNDTDNPTIVSPTFNDVTIDKSMNPVSSQDGSITFMGTYKPFASTTGLLLDSHNPDNGSFHAALSVETPTQGERDFIGWYTDAGFTTPVTTIPFAENGTVTLYAKFEDNPTDVPLIPYPAKAEDKQDGSWYTIDGRLLEQAPTAPGLYMYNGETILLK